MGLAQNEYMYAEEFTNAFRDFKNIKYPLYKTIFQFTHKYISFYVNVETFLRQFWPDNFRPCPLTVFCASEL